MRVILSIPVNPEPWAIGPIGVSNKGGKARGFVGQNQQLRNYQDAVKEDIRSQIILSELYFNFPVSSPVILNLFFFRRLDDYQSVTGRKSSRNAADATNMQKAFEDAIQGLLIVNDRNNIQVSSAIMEQGPHVAPGTIMVMQWSENLTPDTSQLNSATIAAARQKFELADKFIFNNEV